MYLKPTTSLQISLNMALRVPILQKVMDRLLKILEENEIESRKYFSPSLNKLPYAVEHFSCEVSEDISSRILTLPMGGSVYIEDVKRISDVVAH